MENTLTEYYILLHLLRYPVFLFLFLTAGRFLTLRSFTIRSILGFIFLGFSSAMPIYAGDPVNILGSMPFFFAGFMLLYKDPPLIKLSLAMLLFTLNTAVNAITDSLRLLMYSSSSIEAAVEITYPMLFLHLLRLLFWVLLWLIARRYIPKDTYHLKNRLWLLLDFMSIMPFIAIILLISSGTDSRLLLYTVLLTSLFLSSAFLYLIVLLYYNQKLEKNQTLWQMRRLYYEELEQRQKQIRILKHDMNNHLQTMNLLSEAEIKPYLEELLKSQGPDRSRTYCENATANAVLSGKLTLFEERQIPTELKLSLPSDLPMEDIDICALFSNALDNALEANMRLEPQRRFLVLRCGVSRGLLMLYFKNPLPAALIRKSGRIQSVKKDKTLHGLGLLSIQDVAERHHGIMQTLEKEGYFELIVSIPMKTP